MYYTYIKIPYKEKDSIHKLEFFTHDCCVCLRNFLLFIQYFNMPEHIAPDSCRICKLYFSCSYILFRNNQYSNILWRYVGAEKLLTIVAHAEILNKRNLLKSQECE